MLAFIMYADDTTLSTVLHAFRTELTNQNMGEKINTELSKISIGLIVYTCHPNYPEH